MYRTVDQLISLSEQAERGEFVYDWDDESRGKRQREVVPPPSVVAPFCATEVSIIERTDALVRGLNVLLIHHGADKQIQGELSKQFHQCLDTSPDETVWLKRAKHALTYPLAKYLDNEPPSAPDVAFKPTGALRGWFRARINAFNRKNTHLWYSWLQVKRAALPVSDEIVDGTYTKHFETLSRADDGDWDTINDIFSDDTFIACLEKLRGLVRRHIGRGDGFSFLEGRTTKSACFEKTRSGGGQIWKLRELAGLTGLHAVVDEFSGFVWCPRFYGRETSYNVLLTKVTVTGLDEWSQLGTHALLFDTAQPLSCTIQAVLEPMKVRVISKGNALPYYLARPMQKVLHDEMRTWSCFRLIGRPFCPTDMMDLYRRTLPTDEWFSVDYSAATDGLSYRYSGRILRYLTADLPDWERECFEQVLGMHKLHYPPPCGGTCPPVFRGMQQRGQLMGSILSFPILCLANLGVYLSVTREMQNGWKKSERLRHVLVNGDDMLYAAPKALWDVHVATAKKVGLEMSPGKAYHHSTYANVNSTSVHFDLVHEGTTPWQIDYLNTGLYFGQHKVLGKSEVAEAHMGQDPMSGAVANLNVTIRGSLPGRACSLLESYLSQHAEEIARDCRTRDGMTRNLFLPESSGGMGCFAPPGWRWSCTSRQRQYAYYLLRSGTAQVSHGLPLPGFPVEKWDGALLAPWHKPERDVRPIYSRAKFSKLRCVVHLPLHEWSVRQGEFTA